MLEVSNVYCGYSSVDVIQDISFKIADNENLCVIGPNGCGKTTLLRAIAGLLPYRGQIRINSADVSLMKRRDTALKVGLMSQLTSIYFSYTVYEAVMLGRFLHIKGFLKEPSGYDKEFVMHCLETVGLADIKDKQITSLSGGQLQRVFIARTFAQDPQIILLDEPTNHLDLKYQIELIEYLRKWSVQAGRSVVGVLHDVNLALELSDKLLLLSDGRTAAFGTRAEITDGGLLEAAYGVDVKAYMIGVLKKWL